MLVHVHLYGAVRIVAGQPIVSLHFDARSVPFSQLMRALVQSYPRMRSYLVDETDALHANIRVLINEQRPDTDVTLDTQLYPDDRVALLIIVAGGRG